MGGDKSWSEFQEITVELFQLRYFAAAARLNNFSRAAEEVAVSQPSLSLQIANLEREVGAVLFERAGRTVRLTDAGRVLHEHAERILAAERDALRAVRSVVGLERGRLSLWTLPTPGQNLLPRALAPFRQRYPGIEITLHEAVPARRVAEAVSNGQADLGFVHLPHSIDGLNEWVLFTEEMALVVPENDPLTGKSIAPTLAELSQADWIWAPEGTTPEHPMFAACLAAGFTPRIACVSGSSHGMQSLVAAGLGIALLPRLALLHPVSGVKIVELAPPRPTRTVAAVWRGELTHAARAFLQMVQEIIRE